MDTATSVGNGADRLGKIISLDSDELAEVPESAFQNMSEPGSQTSEGTWSANESVPFDELEPRFSDRTEEPEGAPGFANESLLQHVPQVREEDCSAVESVSIEDSASWSGMSVEEQEGASGSGTRDVLENGSHAFVQTDFTHGTIRVGLLDNMGTTPHIDRTKRSSEVKDDDKDHPSKRKCMDDHSTPSPAPNTDLERLRQSIFQTQADLQMYKNEIDTIWQSISQTQADIQMYNKEIDSLSQSISQTQADMQLYNEEIASLLQSLMEANARAQENEQQKRKLLAELNECRVNLYSLQPLAAESDSNITGEYEQLIMTVTQFVERLFGDLEGRNNGDAAIHKLQQEENTEDPMTEGLMKRYLEVTEWIISHLFIRLLHDRFFHEAKIFEFVSKDAIALREVEEGMKKLRPKRDPMKIDHWRSESLMALMLASGFVEAQQSYACTVAKTLWDSIRKTFPKLPFPKKLHMVTFRDCVVLPALKLAMRIRAAPEEYYVDVQAFSNQGAALSASTLRQARLRDVKTRRPLEAENLIFMTNDGWKARVAFLIEPALVKKARNGRPDVLLRKALLAVELIAARRTNEGADDGDAAYVKNGGR